MHFALGIREMRLLNKRKRSGSFIEYSQLSTVHSVVGLPTCFQFCANQQLLFYFLCMLWVFFSFEGSSYLISARRKVKRNAMK